MTNPNVLPQTMAECYLDHQPELLCTIFDELAQERPDALSALFSPGRSEGVTSVGPASSVLSYISNSSNNIANNQAQQQQV